MTYYSERNWANIAKLANQTKKAATSLLKWAEGEQIEVLIYETIRTTAQQKSHVASGASQTMKSYHIVGQAFDFVPAKGQTIQWDGYNRADMKKFIAKAKTLGFEWGGDWRGLVDKPHMQFNYKGYGSDSFEASAPKTDDLGLVAYMNLIGLDSSYGHRMELAAKYGITGYRGTASQNITLLSKIKVAHNTKNDVKKHSISATVQDVTPLLPKPQFKSQTPLRLWKTGTKVQIGKHSRYWHKTSVQDKNGKWVTGYIYHSMVTNLKPVKGTDKFEGKIKAFAIWWDDMNLHGGAILTYKPGTKLSHYPVENGLKSAYFAKQKKVFFTPNYFLK